jgi:hypothetical protein
MEKTINVQWTLTKERVELEMGKTITEDEFDLFAKHFQNNLEAQFDDTLEWQASDWDEVKTWDL